MRNYELIRKFSTETHSIILWIAANEGACELCVDMADKVCLAAEAIVEVAEESDETAMEIAELLMNTFRAISRVRVVDTEDGEGGEISESEDI